MSNYLIPFNRPLYVGVEIDYIKKAIFDYHISGDGNFTQKCSLLLEQELCAQKVLLTTSCTHALEMAALLLEIREADEIIVPSYTFVSTVNAFVLRGAKPVFIDIRKDTLNLDETKLEKLITKRTKAIVPVHYAGVGCEMDAILEIAKKYEIPVVEDNAQGLYGKYKGKFLGTIGELATQSFHETKNFTSGEGGALLINDLSYIERAEIIREKGTNRKQFFRGEVDRYNWRDVGSSYLPADILAAYLLAQLESKDNIQNQREKIWNQYLTQLESWAQEQGVGLPHVPGHCEQTYHMFYLILPSKEFRGEFIIRLREKGIQSVFHYQPLNTSPMGKTWGYKGGECPISEDISDRLVRLPIYYSLREDEQEQVCSAIREIRFDEKGFIK